MCNLYSIRTNQAAIIALFRVINRYVGNLPPMPGVFPRLSLRQIAIERLLDLWGPASVPRRCGCRTSIATW